MHYLSLIGYWYNCFFFFFFSLECVSAEWIRKTTKLLDTELEYTRYERSCLSVCFENSAVCADAFFNSAKCNNCAGRCPLQSRQMRIPAGQFTSFLGLAWSARCANGGGYPRECPFICIRLFAPIKLLALKSSMRIFNFVDLKFLNLSNNFLSENLALFSRFYKQGKNFWTIGLIIKLLKKMII